jgi:diguanylate cyclase (GGDEF)-like protein
MPENNHQVALRRLPPAFALLFTVCLLVAGPVSLTAESAATPVQVETAALLEGLSLEGGWRFRPGDDPAWAAPSLEDGNWAERPVPGRWPEGGYPEHGQLAWYRLTLQLDPALAGTTGIGAIAIQLGDIFSAYELYAGGQRVGGVGRLPPLPEVDYDRKRVLAIPPTAVAADGRLVLALRVWGGEDIAVQSWSAGPRSGEFRLGEYRELLMALVISELPGLLLCMLIGAFGLYHLYLYMRNRTLDTYLWFGATALNFAIYGLMLTQWKYLSDLSFLALKKIEFGSIYLFPAVCMQLVWSLLGLRMQRWLRVYQLYFAAAAVMVVAVPGHTVHYVTLHGWQLSVLPAMAITIWMILREAQRGNPEARTVALGTFVFMATCINDLLIDLAHLDTVRLAPFGFLAILISMAVSMANRFTGLFSRMETKVAERTVALREANEKLAEAARVDHLTGLLNRRGFNEEAEAESFRAFRSGRQFSIVLADVDRFKQVNDEYGHACGDHVLKRVATLLAERTRDVDRVARWGGEEFMLLLPETDAEGAAVLAEKLREAIAENLFEYSGQRLSITMTFGIAEHRKGEALEACIARADTALYTGKERGRNKVMIGKYRGLTLVS